jgi:hypothetical protein
VEITDIDIDLSFNSASTSSSTIKMFNFYNKYHGKTENNSIVVFEEGEEVGQKYENSNT